MAWVPFDSYLENLLTGEYTGFIDHDGVGPFKIALITDTEAPVPETHVYWADLDENEVSGTGYTAGGNEVDNAAVTVAAHVVTWDADDPTKWSQNALGFTDARYAILYLEQAGPTPATSQLIAYYDLGGDKGNVAGDLTLQLDADGIATLATA